VCAAKSNPDFLVPPCRVVGLVDRHSEYLAKGNDKHHKASQQYFEKLGLLDEVPPHIGFITAHEGRYSKLRLITKKAATKVTPAVDKYMLAWSAVKGRYINSSVSNKKVNSAAIVECKGFKVRERQI
jgi:hypothetical protein